MHNSISKYCFNAKPLAYYFYVKAKITIDFQICISVPLTSSRFSFKISIVVLWIISTFCFISPSSTASRGEILLNIHDFNGERFNFSFGISFHFFIQWLLIAGDTVYYKVIVQSSVNKISTKQISCSYFDSFDGSISFTFHRQKNQKYFQFMFLSFFWVTL